jgi:hypothetical protein
LTGCPFEHNGLLRRRVPKEGACFENERGDGYRSGKPSHFEATSSA